MVVEVRVMVGAEIYNSKAVEVTEMVEEETCSSMVAVVRAMAVVEICNSMAAEVTEMVEGETCSSMVVGVRAMAVVESCNSTVVEVMEMVEGVTCNSTVAEETVKAVEESYRSKVEAEKSNYKDLPIPYSKRPTQPAPLGVAAVDDLSWGRRRREPPLCPKKNARTTSANS
ncbi:unnamed protein product [Cuscuta campestris]|uniref:Uncharacterized protein n=1 Tax=Cuscuta campestris TaxID=132261 RepID=A0A484KS12_9ASTE|nr:unnamed protein product [Cuscuta campestris]